MNKGVLQLALSRHTRQAERQAGAAQSMWSAPGTIGLERRGVRLSTAGVRPKSGAVHLAIRERGESSCRSQAVVDVQEISASGGERRSPKPNRRTLGRTESVPTERIECAAVERCPFVKRNRADVGGRELIIF